MDSVLTGIEDLRIGLVGESADRGSVRFAFFLAQKSYTSKLMNKNNKRTNLISDKVIIFFIAEQKVLRKANEIFNYSSIESLFE
jgi:hypothetical protein